MVPNSTVYRLNEVRVLQSKDVTSLCHSQLQRVACVGSLGYVAIMFLVEMYFVRPLQPVSVITDTFLSLHEHYYILGSV